MIMTFYLLEAVQLAKRFYIKKKWEKQYMQDI